jgi:hypothetical protein
VRWTTYWAPCRSGGCTRQFVWQWLVINLIDKLMTAIAASAAEQDVDGFPTAQAAGVLPVLHSKASQPPASDNRPE